MLHEDIKLVGAPGSLIFSDTACLWVSSDSQLVQIESLRFRTQPASAGGRDEQTNRSPCLVLSGGHCVVKDCVIEMGAGGSGNAMWRPCENQHRMAWARIFISAGVFAQAGALQAADDGLHDRKLRLVARRGHHALRRRRRIPRGTRLRVLGEHIRLDVGLHGDSLPVRHRAATNMGRGDAAATTYRNAAVEITAPSLEPHLAAAA